MVREATTPSLPANYLEVQEKQIRLMKLSVDRAKSEVRGRLATSDAYGNQTHEGQIMDLGSKKKFIM